MTRTDSKAAILAEVARRGRVANPKDLVTACGRGHGVHNLVHQLWALQKLGLVQFKEVHQGSRSIPSDIRATAAGRVALKKGATR